MAAMSVLMVLVVILMTHGGKSVAVADQVHHVVGEDRGWDSSTDLASWSSDRIFRVGDKIWFTYSAAEGRILELKTKEEYDSCDFGNPIKMYTDGIDGILLDGEGIRYFVSSNSDNCKNGLKLHVEVMPQGTHDAPKVASSEGSRVTVAAGPTPSGSAHLGTSFVYLAAGFWLVLHGLG